MLVLTASLFACADSSQLARTQPSQPLPQPPSSLSDYEIPEHIRERQTLRNDGYSEPRPDNAPIDPQYRGFFYVPDPDATQSDDAVGAMDSSLDGHEGQEDSHGRH